MKYFTLSLITFLMIVFTSQTFAQRAIRKMLKSPYNYEVESLGVGQDGTKLVKIWGYSKKAHVAVMEAERNAVAAAIFRGYPAGNGAAATPALCSDHSCFENNRKFFDEFFKPGGKYLQFVNRTNDGMPGGRDRIKMKKGYKVAVKASVAHRNLREYLEQEGLIKSLDSGF